MVSDFEQTLESAKRGDEQSFTELFRSVQPGLLRFLGTIGGTGLAEDVASDTWVSVVRGLDRFNGDEAGWRAWVFKIGRARLVDAQRRLVRSPIPFDTQLVLEDCADALDVFGSVEEMYSTQTALTLIGTLPKDQAEVVLLRHVVGLDVAHTARVVGKRPGAVRVADHRGLRRLAALLNQRDGLLESTRCNRNDPVSG